MKKLFKNARVVDIENESFYETDILVENGKIIEFGKFEDFEGEVIDLEGSFVLPSFVNSFFSSKGAMIANFRYSETDFEDKNFVNDVKNLFVQKNLLAGSVYFNDVAFSGEFVVENVEEFDEKALSKVSMEVAQAKKRPFLKFGQDLQSLGSVDKLFGKSAPFVFEDFGFLDRKAVVVGGNCLEKDDFQLLRNYDADFVVLPSEDGRFGRRQTNIVSLFSHGFEVSVGSGCSAEIDFFAVMRQMLSNMRSMFEDENIISEKDVFKIATNGAVLKIKNRVEVGENASFIVIFAKESLYQNVLQAVLYESDNSDILLCVKDGVVLQKNSEILMKNHIKYGKIIRNLKHKEKN